VPHTPELEYLDSAHSVAVARHFLSEADISHFSGIAPEKCYRPSTVATPRSDKGPTARSSVRVADTCHLLRGAFKDPVHTLVGQRILAMLAQLRAEHDYGRAIALEGTWDDRHLEELQATRYQVSGKYDWHADSYSNPPRSCEPGSDAISCRVYTGIVYTGCPMRGGSTSIRMDDEHGDDVVVTCERGMALFFPSRLVHRGDPVLAGAKHILTQWVQRRPRPAYEYYGMAIPAALDRLTGAQTLLPDLFDSLQHFAHFYVSRQHSEMLAILATGSICVASAVAVVAQRQSNLSRCTAPAPRPRRSDGGRRAHQVESEREMSRWRDDGDDSGREGGPREWPQPRTTANEVELCDAGRGDPRGGEGDRAPDRRWDEGEGAERSHT
jgi:hypothetical protein